MTWNKRFFIEAVVFAALVLILYLTWQVAQGMLLTANYVPAIIESYESVDQLDKSVTIGYSASGHWGWSAAAATAAFVGLAAGYYMIRYLMKKKSA
ncbi:hypothetical protein M6D81_01600 [Paenibacillus sp. J5C_2022]|uniref:hypothetical protein n=1 Tax=Paenibacillus sp. J5C2022 TaxID=2977129 RepID=UPI0021D1AA5B|nr:hypothetical protein [Paenibacillus sp. J5C2022]MCU6707390.1 hypothetical protein [Paenibacillus sp. J5C2022]